MAEKQARHLGVVTGDTLIVIGSQRELGGAFSYKKGDHTFVGEQKMAAGLKTTVEKYKVGCYYPIRITNLNGNEEMRAFHIKLINGDKAFGHVTHNGNRQYVTPEEKTMNLADLLLVKHYSSMLTSEHGIYKETDSGKIPILQPTPPKAIAKAPVRRGSPSARNGIPAIVISQDPRHIQTYLESSSGGKILVVITHKATPGLRLRHFEAMADILKIFKTQGSMDQGNQGLSCGVEAVFNAGFEVTAKDFNEVAGSGVDVSQFMVSERGKDSDALDDYIKDTGGGNSIPSNQMFATLQTKCQELCPPLEMEESLHCHIDNVSKASFWAEHKWAVVMTSACRGHWVSIEKILYGSDSVPALCLREGRGTTRIDLVTDHSNRKRPR